MYEVFDHTADLGLRISAPTRAQLCEDAARALTEIIAGDPRQIRPTQPRSFDVPGQDPSYLLFDWLNELLYAFESERMLFREFDVKVGPEGLRGLARGEPYDPSRHTLAHEVKAITYHGLEVLHTDGRWEATVIVDI